MRFDIKRILLVALVALFFSPQLVLAQAKKPAHQAKPTPAQIDKNGALILIRSTLIALDQANKTGNYTVLRDLGAPGFQAANTPARLAEIFAKERSAKLDLSGVVVLEPQLNQLPEIDSNGMMRMTGFFPSVPTQIKFDLLYAPVGGQWRLFGIAVGLGQAAPTAPSSNVPASTAKKDQQRKPQEKQQR